MKTWQKATYALVRDNWGKLEPHAIAELVNKYHEVKEDGREFRPRTTAGGVVYAAQRLGLNAQREVDDFYKARANERRKVIPLREAVLKRDGYKCLKCGSTTDLEVDHVQPVALGGRTEMGNLQTLCESCNWNKGLGSDDYRP